MKERFRAAATDAPDTFDPQVILGVGLLFGLLGIPCLYYGTELGLHGRGNSDQFVREALWGKPGGFDSNHPLYKAIKQLSAVRDSRPELRYGRLYFRPISGDGRRFGASSFAPGVLAFSRILNNREVVVVVNANTQIGFPGSVLVDFFINKDGERFKVLNNSAATAPGAVETRSGLEIHEIDGGVTSGPAKMIRVDLKPMEIQILGK
jgi:glycosidase